MSNDLNLSYPPGVFDEMSFETDNENDAESKKSGNERAGEIPRFAIVARTAL